VADRTESRFPFSEYPKGWFQVAYSRDVDSREINPLRYFGAEEPTLASW
jgi:hypothetical protein